LIVRTVQSPPRKLLHFPFNPNPFPADLDLMQPLILIIDDDEALSDAMRESLRELGYNVVCAETSAAGLAAARKHRPDIILCDIMLPDAQGFDTVKELRADSITSDIPVVLITGNPDAAQYEGAGKCMILLKPFYIETLEDVVRGTLAARDAKRAAHTAAAS